MATSARTRRDPLTLAGLGIVAIAAAGTSFTALSGLAGAAGWSQDVRPALPVIVDVLAAVSTRAWLSSSASGEAKRFAKRTALFSIALSMAGNIAYHLTVAGYLHPGVALVILVGLIPPLGLACAAHLVAVLRTAEPVTEPVTVHLVDAEPMVIPAPAEVRQVPLVTAQPVAKTAVEVDTEPVITAATSRTPRRTDTAVKVAKLAAKHPDMRPAAMAVKLGVSDRTVRRHLAALAAA